MKVPTHMGTYDKLKKVYFGRVNPIDRPQYVSSKLVFVILKVSTKYKPDRLLNFDLRAFSWSS
jgi:hypothetical protein